MARPGIKTTLETRKANLRILVAQWGGATSLAVKLGYKGPSYISQMLGGNRPITEPTARAIEQRLDLPAGWMDAAQDTNGRPEKIDDALISQVITLVGTYLQEAGTTLAPAKFSDVVSIVYADALKAQRIDEALIARLVKLVS